jgi:hypothetical protein
MLQISYALMHNDSGLSSVQLNIYKYYNIASCSMKSLGISRWRSHGRRFGHPDWDRVIVLISASVAVRRSIHGQTLITRFKIDVQGMRQCVRLCQS